MTFVTNVKAESVEIKMIRQCTNDDIDTVMKIWLDTNIRAHDFISADYWKCNFDMVKEILPLAEIYAI